MGPLTDRCSPMPDRMQGLVEVKAALARLTSLPEPNRAESSRKRPSRGCFFINPLPNPLPVPTPDLGHSRRNNARKYYPLVGPLSTDLLYPLVLQPPAAPEWLIGPLGLGCVGSGAVMEIGGANFEEPMIVRRERRVMAVERVGDGFAGA